MISVAMCTYNGERFLSEQLKSIFSQTCPPDEIIICDDCSKDHTVQLAHSLLSQWNGKWKIIQNEKNLGFRKNFEQVIQLCQGDIIFLSDQDDVWMPEKIGVMMRVFKNHANVILAFHDAEIVDRNLSQLASSFWNILDFNPECFCRSDYRQLLGHNVVQGSACAFRKELVHCACPFPTEAIHDEWLALAALSMGKIYPITNRLLKYRQWEGNAIGGKRTVAKILKESLFTMRNIASTQREYILRKNKINKEWIRRYRNKIQMTYPYMIDTNNVMEQRCHYIKGKSFRIISIWGSYFKLYPRKKSALKEFTKDIISVIF